MSKPPSGTPKPVRKKRNNRRPHTEAANLTPQRRMKRDGTLDPRDYAIIAALCSGATRAEAAARVGVSDRTIRRRQEEGAFAAALRQAEQKICEDVVRVGLTNSLTFISVLAALAKDVEVSSQVRVSACRAGLEATRSWREHSNFAVRLAELEEVLRQDSAPVQHQQFPAA